MSAVTPGEVLARADSARFDALRKDALRYRFMRDEFAKESSDAAGAFAALEPMTGVDFDAAIDAAMGAAS